MDLTPTPSQTAGPFLHLGLTDTRSVSCVAGEGAKGERMWLTLRVLDGDGLPVPDAMIELWQADSEGNYKNRRQRRLTQLSAALDDWRRRKMDRVLLKRSRPGRVPGPADTLQAPHINVSMFATRPAEEIIDTRLLCRRSR